MTTSPDRVFAGSWDLLPATGDAGQLGLGQFVIPGCKLEECVRFAAKTIGRAMSDHFRLLERGRREACL
jgi:hypothetical protein